MIIKKGLRKVISNIVALAMVVSVLAVLDFGVITAEAIDYNIGTNDGFAVNSDGDVTAQFTISSALDTGEMRGWLLCLFKTKPSTGSNNKLSNSGNIHPYSYSNCAYYFFSPDTEKVTGTRTASWNGTATDEKGSGKTLAEVIKEQDWHIVIGPRYYFTGWGASGIGAGTDGIWENGDYYVGPASEKIDGYNNPIVPPVEETTYNVKLDCTNYTETKVELYTYDVVDGSNQNREMTSTNGATITVAETGFARVFVYGGEFTVTAEGATVGEIINADDEGYYREITNFTKDTTVVVNAVIPHVCIFGEWEITTPATATSDGVKTRKCDCGKSETAVVNFVPAADGDTGNLTEDTNAAENECKADIVVDAEDIITDIGLKDEEIKAIENGKNISVYLDVKNADTTVSTGDKTAAESKLTDDMEIGMFLDINLFKKIDNNGAENITSTLKPIKITFIMPDELIKNGRIFSIVRVHNGSADILSCNFDAATKTASFETNKFSSYAIAYKDSANGGGNTGGNPVIPNIPVVTGAPTTTPAEDEEDVENDEDVDEDDIVVDEDDIEVDEDDIVVDEDDIVVDEDTDTTKPADDEDDDDETDKDVDSDDDAEVSDIDVDKNETDNDTDGNPETGVAVGLAGVLVAGAVVLLFGKRK